MSHVHRTAAAYGPALVPVIKGNGYGFGRTTLHDLVVGTPALGRTVCVGSVAELADVPAGVTPVVLTPTLSPPLHARPGAAQGEVEPILTVGHPTHAAVLDDIGGPVMVKLASSMRRYGTTPDDLPELLAGVRDAGCTVAGFALHLPITGDDTDRMAEVESWLAVLDPIDGGRHELWLSHLAPESFHALSTRHPERRLRLRVGTMLWHGVPRIDALHLRGTVLQTREVRVGDTVGYHDSAVPVDGTLVCVGVGSSHGVRPLDHPEPHRRSPFHFDRRRLFLLERPHMHTSLCLVPAGDPCPRVGDMVDVQQPFIDVHVDELDWLP